MAEKRPARFKHFANIGDIIASLPAVKKFYETTGRKVIYLQQLNVPAEYYANAVHPTLDESGTMVMCNQKMFDMIRPLLLSQEYIADMEVYNGQLINVDLDVIRKKIFVNLPHQAIQQWIFMAYPDLAADLSKAWVYIGEVDISDCYFQYRTLVTSYLPMDDLKDMAILNFTERYRSADINYYFLRNHQNRLVFAGTEKEHQIFCDRWQLEIPRLIVNNFLQLAYIMKQVRFIQSNQSFMWNVAESMKTPRVVELCQHAPNVQAFIGEHSYGYLHQAGAKYYFELLMKK
jgi:hypothetical protein